MTPLESLTKKIKKLREDRGLSQYELAEKMGHKSVAYIAFVESGKRNINLKDFFKLAEALGVPPEYFFGVNTADFYAQGWLACNEYIINQLKNDSPHQPHS